MSRPTKFGQIAKKIGIILPIETVQKLDEIARARGGDRSLTVYELISNASITTTTCLTPKPQTQTQSEIERKIHDAELHRGYKGSELPTRKRRDPFGRE